MGVGKQGVVAPYIGGSQILPSGRLRVAMDEEIHLLNIDKSILLFLLDKIGKKAVKQMKFEWMDQERKADWVQTTAIGGSWASGAAASGTLTVDTANAWLFAAGDIIQIPAIAATTIYVDSVNQGSGVITARTVKTGTINLSGLASSLPLIFLLSNSFEDGTGMGTIKSQQPDELYNYIQIMQTPVGVTTTSMHLDYRGGGELDKQRKEAGIDHAFKIEKQLFFGEKYRLATGLMDGVYEQWFTGGLYEACSSNVKSSVGALTRAIWGQWIRDVTRYGQDVVVFAGETIFEALTTWSEGKLQVQRSDKAFGMAVGQYLTQYGDLVTVIPHREVLKEAHAGKAFAVDMADVEYRYLDGMDTHLEVDIQTPDKKQKIDEFRTWFGLWIGNEKRHGLMTGVTSITA